MSGGLRRAAGVSAGIIRANSQAWNFRRCRICRCDWGSHRSDGDKGYKLEDFVEEHFGRQIFKNKVKCKSAMMAVLKESCRVKV